MSSATELTWPRPCTSLSSPLLFGGNVASTGPSTPDIGMTFCATVRANGSFIRIERITLSEAADCWAWLGDELREFKT